MKRVFFLLITTCTLTLACKEKSNETKENDTTIQSQQQDNDGDDDWGNLSTSDAKRLVKSFCEYCDSLGEPNATKSVWFSKDNFKSQFLGFTQKLTEQTDTVEYDGFRMYFGRYPNDWSKAEHRYINTMVITKTKAVKTKNGILHEDILKEGKNDIIVKPLNDGGRCKPNCGGTKLLESRYVTPQ